MYKRGGLRTDHSAIQSCEEVVVQLLGNDPLHGRSNNLEKGDNGGLAGRTALVSNPFVP
jgi:hypothetical protein